MCPNVNCHDDQVNYRCICTERSRVAQTTQRENNTGPLIQRGVCDFLGNRTHTLYDHIWHGGLRFTATLAYISHRLCYIAVQRSELYVHTDYDGVANARSCHGLTVNLNTQVMSRPCYPHGRLCPERYLHYTKIVIENRWPNRMAESLRALADSCRRPKLWLTKTYTLLHRLALSINWIRQGLIWEIGMCFCWPGLTVIL